MEKKSVEIENTPQNVELVNNLDNIGIVSTFYEKEGSIIKVNMRRKVPKELKTELLWHNSAKKTGRKNLNNSKNKEIGKFIDSGMNADLSKRLKNLEELKEIFSNTDWSR